MGDRNAGLLPRIAESRSNSPVRDYFSTHNKLAPVATQARTESKDGSDRYGEITVKTPDDWRDNNLMHSMTAIDGEVKRTIDAFAGTLQASLADSPEAGLSSDSTVSESAPPVAAWRELSLSEIAAEDSFDLLNMIPKFEQPVRRLKIKPTEGKCQYSNYASLNQAIGGRSIGDDDTGNVAYGLYLFRVPVSIIPGEETRQGYSAVANIRAKMVTTKADMKYMFPQMAISGLVEALTDRVLMIWDAPDRKTRVEQGIAKYRKQLEAVTEELDIERVETALAELGQDHVGLRDEQLQAKNDEINSLFRCIALQSKVSSLKTDGLLSAADASKCLEKLGASLNKASNLDKHLDWVETNLDRTTRLAEAIQSYASLVSCVDEAPAGFSDLEKDARAALARQFKKTKSPLSDEELVEIQADVLDKVEWSFRAKEAFETWEDQDQEWQDIDLSITVLPFTPTNSGALQPKSTGLNQLQISFEETEIVAVRELLKSSLISRAGSKPQPVEIRTMLFDVLQQTNTQLNKLGAYDLISERGSNAIQLSASDLELGRNINPIAADWRNQLNELSLNTDERFLRTAWLLARQCGLVDLNIKRVMRKMRARGEVTQQEVKEAEFLNFFVDGGLPQTKLIWEKIVEKEFPLQVFMLPPIEEKRKVQEEDQLDAAGRLRRTQIALAYSVALGNWTAKQRIALSRKLANEPTAIDWDQSTVGFVQGMDNFGWHFNPRHQTSVSVIRDGRVAGKILKTTILTGPDAARSMRLEPGTRDCEVLIAIPSFVSHVEFVVTTSWENLAKPKRPKASVARLSLRNRIKIRR